MCGSYKNSVLKIDAATKLSEYHKFFLMLTDSVELRSSFFFNFSTHLLFITYKLSKKYSTIITNNACVQKPLIGIFATVIKIYARFIQKKSMVLFKM